MPRRSKTSRDADEVFAEVMERVQLRVGMSDAALAKACGLAPAAIWKIKKANPRRQVSVGEAVDIASAFGLTVDQMLASKVPQLGVDVALAVIADYINTPQP